MNARTLMERCFGWLLQTSWQAAVIAILILLAQWLLRKRLSPAWRHGLWLLLVARLLMPLTPSSATSIFNLAKWSRRQPTTVRFAAVPDSASAPNSSVATSVSAPVALELKPPPAPEVRTEVLSQPGPAIPLPVSQMRIVSHPGAPSFNWMRFAATVWLAGALVLGLHFVWVDDRFRRRLARCLPASDDSILQVLAQCRQSLRLSQRVLPIETDEVASPAVYGLWRKRLLLPAGLREQLSPEELRHVLLHELAHVKRRDLELNWLMAVLQIVHWFNPVVWFAFNRMRADRELATDDLALAQTRPADRRCYGETIVKVLEALAQRRVLPGLVGIGESKAQIRGLGRLRGGRPHRRPGPHQRP